MKVTCFGSGSDGNAHLIQSGETALLVDSGVPVRGLRSGLRQAGVLDGELSAILISHEHHDHIRSARQISRYQPVPFYGTAGTERAMGRKLVVDWETISDGQQFAVKNLRITPVMVSHDAQEPVGFIVEEGDLKVAIFTDLGEPNADVASAIQGASLIIIEANYDAEMLRIGPYPAHLKKRIRGPLGHLANDECAELIENHIDGQTTDVWLAHLSEKNNRPDIAKLAVEKRLRSTSAVPKIVTLPRFGQSVFWDSVAAANRPQQTSLF